MNGPVHSFSTATPTDRAPARETTRTNDPERTRANILAVAEQEFGEKGLAGARIDEIAAATQTSKRMIYYYFGSKEGLYLAVLEESYRKIRQEETDLHLESLAPEAALKRLVGFTFDRHLRNESYVRIVMSENIHRGQFMRQSQYIQDLNTPAIDAIRELYERGVAAGVFRPGLDLLDIHASISALSFFNVSNRHTFGLIFKQDTLEPGYLERRRDSVIDMVWRHLRQ
ncbi:MAG: TetR/AcrR family transcriptional regulator [Burkholderiales bacterium]|nr:TetR/AcrR family transcriptional regulator [Burkholderiales bacterium]